MNRLLITTFLAIVITPLSISVSYAQNKVAQHLQDVSVTIKAGNSEGSGVIISRDLLLNKDAKEKTKVNFIWTCAHVVDGLRSTRTVIDGQGKNKTIIEFKDAQVVKELVDDLLPQIRLSALENGGEAVVNVAITFKFETKGADVDAVGGVEFPAKKAHTRATISE